jgi:hypothetical protein
MMPCADEVGESEGEKFRPLLLGILQGRLCVHEYLLSGTESAGMIGRRAGRLRQMIVEEFDKCFKAEASRSLVRPRPVKKSAL